MHRPWRSWALLAGTLGIAVSLATPCRGAALAAHRAEAPVAGRGGAAADPAGPLTFSALALELPRFEAPGTRSGGRRARGRTEETTGLGVERARILLRSLTVPGWGQATLGRNTSAAAFAIAETGVWASFVAFRVQEVLRRHSYEVTAQLFAGIDLDGRDEEFRRIVGLYPSSEEYNRLVVMRDAANLYYDDPERYRQYIAEHALQGRDAWAWESFESFATYREQRKDTRRAAQRANTALALAIANRLLSAVHAARYAGEVPEGSSWRIECGPAPGDPTNVHLGVSVRF